MAWDDTEGVGEGEVGEEAIIIAGKNAPSVATEKTRFTIPLSKSVFSENDHAALFLFVTLRRVWHA